MNSNVKAEISRLAEASDDELRSHDLRRSEKRLQPTLEACKIPGMDSRRICKLYNERSTDRLVKEIHPNLKFTRNYEKLRPYFEYCEEMIVLEEGTE